MKSWCKLLPFFIVEWLAVKHLGRMNIDGWIYVNAFGPGTPETRQRSVLIEVEPSERPNWNVATAEEKAKLASRNLVLMKMKYGIREENGDE